MKFPHANERTVDRGCLAAPASDDDSFKSLALAGAFVSGTPVFMPNVLIPYFTFAFIPGAQNTERQIANTHA